MKENFEKDLMENENQEDFSENIKETSKAGMKNEEEHGEGEEIGNVESEKHSEQKEDLNAEEVANLEDKKRKRKRKNRKKKQSQNLGGNMTPTSATIKLLKTCDQSCQETRMKKRKFMHLEEQNQQQEDEEKEEKAYVVNDSAFQTRLDSAFSEPETPAKLYHQTLSKQRVSDSPYSGLSQSKIKQFGLEKYWFQRYKYFSKFDEGILILDQEAWYSVTPELIARHIAQRCATHVIVDGFCGVGGNSIQFALTCEHVIAIDISVQKIQCARNNARIYGVEDKITFLVGDFMKIAPFLKADVVFLSPPWGGPEYLGLDTFRLEMMDICGREVFNVAQQITPNIAFYVPRNISHQDMLSLVSDSSQILCEIEQNQLNSKVKACTVYYGNLVEFSAKQVSSPTQFEGFEEF